MKLWLTAAELAGMPGMPSSRFRVQERAKRESWSQKTEPVRGGQLISYSVDSLPEQTRLAIAQQNASNDSVAQPVAVVMANAIAAGEKTKAARRAADRVAGTALAANVTGPRAEERDDKLRVLVCLERFRQTMGLQLCPAVQAFCEAWNAGAIVAPESARLRFPEFPRWRTVLEWHQALQNQGGAGLTRPPSARAGKFQALSEEVGQRVLAILHDYPHLGAAQVHRLVAKDVAGTAAAANLPAVRSFQRAINHWKETNRQLFTQVTNPDRWRSHYLSAAGSRSEAVNGPNDLWELDGTKGEVMLADGKRWTLTGVIDVGTRRLMVRLSSTARAGIVMGLVRRAIGEWGIPRRVKTDNGSDYVAQQFVLSLTQLAIEHSLCDPFNPQQKPHIERALGTMLHDLFELLPGYLGHNVAQRSDIEARRSFAQRIMKGSGEGGPVELRLTPEQLQDVIDNWLDEYHARVHGGLNGKSPNQVLADHAGHVHVADERALDIFLAAASEGGLRTVGKKGIKLDHGFYNCAELGGLEGQQVQVKQTEADVGVCYVFDLAGNYVGTALDHSRLGISAAEVAAERREHQKKVLTRQKAELKAAVKAVKPQDLVRRILDRRSDEAVDAAPNVTRLRPTATHTSEAIESVARAADPQVGISAAAVETLRRMEEQQATPKAAVIDMSKPDHRYSRCLRLQARMSEGEAIDPRDLNWLHGYAASSEFKALERLHRGTDPLAAEAGG